MGNKIKEQLIRSEKEFDSWFKGNYKGLGYSKILRKDCGIFPDYIMEKVRTLLPNDLLDIVDEFTACYT